MRLQLHLLSFEGPDGYARAGGMASRMTGLAQALAETGFTTHRWFVRDPALPGHEACGRLRLHRWCQWLSRAHPDGVYDSEEGKQQVVERVMPAPGEPGVLRLLERVRDVDMVSICSVLNPDSRRVLLRASDTVLANSRHAPVGLVRLETMAVGGIACTGCSGEDYAISGHYALVLETTDPREFLGLFGELHANPALERAIRRARRRTSQHDRWSEIVARIPLLRLRFLATRASSDHGSTPEPITPLESIGFDATSRRKWKGLHGIRDPPREVLEGVRHVRCALP
jgi:glycosyltransferase involved in cell wall biosynthesis